MRHSLLILSFATAVSVAPLTTFADQGTLDALQQAGVQLSPELTSQVQSAQGDALASAISEVVASLGNDGEAIRNAVAAAVGASPDLAMEIVSEVCLSNPGVCAIAAGGAASAVPAMAPDIAAAAVQAVPTQQNQIANTLIATVNNPAINQAIERAASTGTVDSLEESSSGDQPSPN